MNVLKIQSIYTPSLGHQQLQLLFRLVVFRINFSLWFFSEKQKEIENDFKNLSKIDSSIVFFVSPKKLTKLFHLLKKFYKRKIVICREISKIYEEYIRKDVEQLEKFNNQVKGELTIVISEKYDEKNMSQKLEESDKRIIKLVISKLSIKEIVNLISFNKKISKKEIYDYCLKLKDEK